MDDNIMHRVVKILETMCANILEQCVLQSAGLSEGCHYV